MKIAELSFLVVEDNDFQRETFVKMLKRHGAQSIYSAGNGQQALDVFANLDCPVDIIISDIEMPVMDGMEFIRHVGASGYRNSVIIASAIDRSVTAKRPDALPLRIQFSESAPMFRRAPWPPVPE